MEKKDLIKQYPPKSFAEKFNEKQGAFASLGYDVAYFSNKTKSLQRIFEYDSIVEQLKEEIEKSKTDQLDGKLVSRIIEHFKRIGQLIKFLDYLVANDQRDGKVIFQKFDQELSKAGFVGSLIQKTSEGREINLGKTLLDTYIADVHDILKEIDESQHLPSLEVDIKELEEKVRSAEKLATAIISNKEKYEEAQKAAENWIKTEGQAIANVVQDKEQIFEEKAENEHKGFCRVWLWLVGTGLFGIAAIILSILFITNLSGNGENISIGASLLRIAVVGASFYLAFLCYQQFNIQRRLYEVYKFKAIALSTMKNLVKTFNEHPTDRKLIVSKAIDIIFSEPTFKEDKVAHQKMINELLDVLKNKM